MREAARQRPEREGTRRLTVLLMFTFYGLLLAEGPLRKWIAPGASNALVFLRDPVMILILLLYARLGPSPHMSRALRLLGAVLLVFLLCIMAQLATSGVPPLAIVAGIRNYFLFVPLCCALRDVFNVEDYARWIRLNLILAGPIGVLVIVQYEAGPSAWINAAPGGDTEGVFLLVEDVVRPYGLFSFTLGHSAFSAWMLGVLLAALTARRALAVPRWLLLWGGLGVGAMGAFSGSRTYVLLAGSVLATFVLATAALGRLDAKKVAAGVTLGLGVGLVGVMALAPTVVGDLLDRQSVAVANEGSTAGRIGRVVSEFVGELGQVPVFGVGLGAGTNVANFLSNGRTDHVLAEYELTRMVQELGPFFGLFAILLRWSLAIGFARAALRALRYHNALQPLCFLGFVMPLFLAHDVTLQNSMIGIAWFSAGVFLSALRVGPVSDSRMARPKHSRLFQEGVACG